MLTHENHVGQGHGYHFRDNRHIVAFMAGPNVRRGARVREAHKVTDFMPTILSLLGIEYDPKSMDGRRFTGWVRPADEGDLSRAGEPDYVGPITHSKPLSLVLTLKKPHWETMHDPHSALDPHNIFGNIFGVWNLEFVILIDRLIDLVIPGDKVRPLNSFFDGIEKGYDYANRRKSVDRTGQFLAAFRIREFNVGDLWILSVGHWRRIHAFIDWTQDIVHDVGDIGKTDEEKMHSSGGHWAVEGVQVTLIQLQRYLVKVVVVVGETVIDWGEGGVDVFLNVGRKRPEAVSAPARGAPGEKAR
jgi:hypothetical protein